MGAEIVEDQPRARNEILYGAGNQNLAATGEIAYSGCDIDGDSANVIVVANFDFAGPARIAMPRGLTLLAMACAQRTARAGPSNVARIPSPPFHLSTAEPTNLAAGHREMRIEDRPPRHGAARCEGARDPAGAPEQAG
jgi:hypothetical protein